MCVSRDLRPVLATSLSSSSSRPSLSMLSLESSPSQKSSLSRPSAPPPRRMEAWLSRSVEYSASIRSSGCTPPLLAEARDLRWWDSELARPPPPREDSLPPFDPIAALLALLCLGCTPELCRACIAARKLAEGGTECRARTGALLPPIVLPLSLPGRDEGCCSVATDIASSASCGADRAAWPRVIRQVLSRSIFAFPTWSVEELWRLQLLRLLIGPSTPPERRCSQALLYPVSDTCRHAGTKL